METATAAVGSVLPKLQAYLSNHKEAGDHCGDVIERLGQELGRIQAALLSAAHAPPGQPREEPTGAWAGEARELAYDVEDAVDDLLLLVTPSPPGSLGHTIEGLLQRAVDLSRARPQTAAGVPTATAVDHPRKQHQQPPPPPPDGEAGVVGVDDARDGLIRRLRLRDEAGDNGEGEQVKVVSVVGPAGLGKTTLTGAAYGVLKSQFDCAAFVSVGLDPDIPGVLERAFRQLGVDEEEGDGDGQRDERLLISQLREFLQNKRYFIVLDDLWDKSSWEKIRSALADNSHGSRIVTTTRSLDVADEIGATYELKPLSPENSKKLFFGTVSGCGDKCPDDEFTEVADKLLEKCGGMPLAIITLAKFLAGNKLGDKREWDRVCESIGSGLENTPDVKNMRVAVSTSYYSLPHHLRACLLYMSIFPENLEIRRDRLIWRWIAEGFVQPADGQGEESLFELGQSYFDELVNRSVIQFLDIDFSDDGYRDEYCCSVSFPVMDFIRYLSSQENFVSVLDGEQWRLPSEVPIRRVSIRGGGSKAEDSVSIGSNNTSVPELRSLAVFSPATPEKAILDLKMSKFLRVLDLEGCDLSESQHLLQDHLGSLLHLRYLGLRETRIASVPEGIGNLKLLQTLDLDENLKVFDLPSSITRLGELMCLRVSTLTRLPRGIGRLTALEELSDVSTRYSPDLVKELGSLTKLRALRVRLYRLTRGEEEAFLQSLRSLGKLQTLEVYADGSEKVDAPGNEALWAPPRRLVEFRAAALNTHWSPAARLLPMRRLDAPCLAVVVVKVAELRQRDVDALGALPALRVLRLEPYATAEALHVSGSRGGALFPRLTECRFRDADVAPVFRRGAMPRLRRLEMCFNVRRTVDLGNGGFEFGLENLLCLEEATVYVGCKESTEPEAEAAEAALRRAAAGHPNRADFEVITFGEELMCFDDDDN